LGLNPFVALFLGVAGNLTTTIPVLLLLKPVSGWLSKKIALFERFFDWLFEHTRIKHSHRIDRYGVIGIFIVVAIPAPGMGPWTGSLIAFIFGTRFWPSLIAIVSGTIVGGLILLSGTMGFIALTNLYNPLVSISIVLSLTLMGYLIWRRKQKINN